MDRRRIPRTAALGLVAGALWLSGCGVGISLGIGGDYDDPPSVSLAVSRSSAAPGQSLRLVAAASDDDYVDEVVFYRVDPEGFVTRLCSDTRPEYECDTTLPASARRGSELRFFARAWDSGGQSSDSQQVGVRVD